VKLCTVKIGIFDNTYTEITEGEVTEGDAAITGYLPQWRQTVSKKSSFFGMGSRQ
jgi:hypothetical protein